MDHRLTQVFWFLLTLYVSVSGAILTTFTVVNNCSYTVWPAILSDGSVSTTGFALETGGAVTVDANGSQSVRIWGRTLCEYSSGNFSCVTGDCGSGKVECDGSGATPPVTLVEYSLGTGSLDYYDVSLVDGYNVPMQVAPSVDNCASTGCVVDLNRWCPAELQVKSVDGQVVACKSACGAFNQPQYCCTGDHSTPYTCKPTNYSQMFKSICPNAYTYAYDDSANTTFSCHSADYRINFCPVAYNRSSIANGSIDSINLSHFIRDGMTLVSANGIFELGFFSPGKSNNRYLGIWYKNTTVKTVLWVANRLNPITDSSGILAVNKNGGLVVTISGGTVVWNSTSLMQALNPVAQLLDTGNLVLRDDNATDREAILWQSFDYPSDTLLGGMKFGWDLRTGLSRSLTAWKSPDDPAPGNFYWSFVLHSYPDIYIMRGAEIIHRMGPWNGLYFSGTPELQSIPFFSSMLVSNKDEFYYMFTLKNSSVMTMMVINQTSYLHRGFVWAVTDQNSKIYSTLPRDDCDTYGLCGTNGLCVITESTVAVCQCINGFEPKSLQKWGAKDWSEGCVRKKTLGCYEQVEDVFVKLVGLKLPDTTYTWVNDTVGLEQCRTKCLNNCSCMAYSNSDIRGTGSGCVMWFSDLIDIRQFPAGGQDLYLRVSASELEEHRHRKMIIIVATTAAVIFALLLPGCCYIFKFRSKMTDESKYFNEGQEDDVDLPLFNLPTIIAATDNFSMKNKIGEGGFGSVYKGRLINGQQIAVKRLSKSSRQGMIEFKNEVKLIVKVQHRNLVKLLGCCIQGEEKILIYEYMPNGSLDTFIFDPIKSLDWRTRFNIICGVARGLTYLHQDSRLRIIHRDLKLGNILLDDNLTPKISDFGMAKTFGGEQIEGNTNRVVGTYGYMAPEYAADGLFSIKSDVFSFGILLLEIICGKKNRGFYHANRTLNLSSYAWILWKQGKAKDLIDSNMEDSSNVSEVMRCIHISLLCAQQYPEDRPTMPSVILMLGSEMELVEPKEPGFFPMRISIEPNSSSNQRETRMTNEITHSLEAR